jgi:cytoskeleton protein RodZ
MPDNEDVQAAPRGPVPVLGLGERLRSARKAKALSVEQVASALHLEEASVVALEEGRFEAMGAPVFVRGHLKRYAQLVGLSPETVLDAYRIAAPQSDAPPALARGRAQADGVQIGPWTWWVVGAIVLVALVVALSGGDDGGVQAPAGEPAAPSVPAPAPVASPPAGITSPPAASDAPPPADAGEATAPLPGPAPAMSPEN